MSAFKENQSCRKQLSCISHKWQAIDTQGEKEKERVRQRHKDTTWVVQSGSMEKKPPWPSFPVHQSCFCQFILDLSSDKIWISEHKLGAKIEEHAVDTKNMELYPRQDFLTTISYHQPSNCFQWLQKVVRVPEFRNPKSMDSTWFNTRSCPESMEPAIAGFTRAQQPLGGCTTKDALAALLGAFWGCSWNPWWVPFGVYGSISKSRMWGSWTEWLPSCKNQIKVNNCLMVLMRKPVHTAAQDCQCQGEHEGISGIGLAHF